MAPETRPYTSQAFFDCTTAELRATDSKLIVGSIARRNPFSSTPQALHSWEATADIMREAVDGIEGHVFFEYSIPRLGSRIDVVLISDASLFPIEFKVGAQQYHRADFNQAWDYALDFKNFHETSHAADIFPILLATDAPKSDAGWGEPHVDGVRSPLRTNAAGLADCIRHGVGLGRGPRIDASHWARGQYRPTPTIIEAARALYSRHTVDAISRNDASAKNLAKTATALERIITRSRASREKAVVFVTGVPGAGKTLVGLNVATVHRRTDDAGHAVFLSGNQPLVDVLTEALVRDEVQRVAIEGGDSRKGTVKQSVKQFIQNIHHFRDAAIANPTSPPDMHVAVFDESQRAWTREKTSDFMKRKKEIPDFNFSEPEFLLSYMDRHPDWAVVVCLVGGGQEIHLGEAGISSWLEAARDHLTGWRVFLASTMNEGEYQAKALVDELRALERVTIDEDLHLEVPMRSFRAPSVAKFVRCLLDGERAEAAAAFALAKSTYPIAVTRDIENARSWLRQRVRGSERMGIVASSKAMRLRPDALDVRVDIEPVHWYLDEATDIRSSNFLEEVATEFQVQGLELDWACVSWDADLRFVENTWQHFELTKGDWNSINKDYRQRYQLNSYRVLLTRARQGMVIYVPRGSSTDHTRPAEYYDGIYRLLTSLGIEVA